MRLTDRDTTEQDKIMEEEMEPHSSTLLPTVGQIVALHFHGKKQSIANVYLALASFSKFN